MGRITGRVSKVQYPDCMTTIKDTGMTVIVGMNDQIVGMAVREDNFSKIQRKKRFDYIEFEKYT